MKAIYINLDPYLAAFAAWLKGGKSGPAPTFRPLPLAVTIPLGAEIALIVPADSASYPGHEIANSDDWDAVHTTVDGQSIYYDIKPPDDTSIIASALKPGFSAVVPAATYAVTAAPSAGEFSLTCNIGSDTGDGLLVIAFTVLVRREAPQGPVDLVDFTPPAAAPSAADIKSALVAAGSGALAGVSLDDMTGIDGKPIQYGEPSAFQMVIGFSNS